MRQRSVVLLGLESSVALGLQLGSGVVTHTRHVINDEDRWIVMESKGCGVQAEWTTWDVDACTPEFANPSNRVVVKLIS